MYRFTAFCFCFSLCVAKIESKVCSEDKPDIECRLNCESTCQNGICDAAQKCRCDPGYIESLDPSNPCLPVCDLDCGYGVCVEPNKCLCNPGYELIHTTSHDVCTKIRHKDFVCSSGYIKSDNGTCQPKCSNGCIHGTCVSPDVCVCKPDHSLKEVKDFGGLKVCKPDCDPGYKKVRGVCHPECYHSCGNGTCVSPNVCQCFRGYKIDLKKLLSKVVGNGSLCIPSCNYCKGECTAPNTCIIATVSSTSKSVSYVTPPRLTTSLSTTLRLTRSRSTTWSTRPLTTSPWSTTPRPTSPWSTTPRLTSPRPTSPRPTSPRPTSPRPTSPRPTSPRPTSPRPTSPRPTSPRPTSPRSTSPWSTTPRPTSTLSTSTQPNSSRSTSSRSTSSRSTIPRSTTAQSTTHVPSTTRLSSPLLTISTSITPQSTTIRLTTINLPSGSITFQDITTAAESSITTLGPVKSYRRETWVEKHWASVLLPVVLVLFAAIITLLVWRWKPIKYYLKGRSYAVEDDVSRGCGVNQQIHYTKRER